MDQFLKEARKYCTDQGLVVDDFDQVDQQHPNRPKHQRKIPSYFINGTFCVDQDARAIQEEIPGNDSPRDLFK
jgi:hypothetical protein